MSKDKRLLDRPCASCGGEIWTTASNGRKQRYCNVKCMGAGTRLRSESRFWEKVDKSAGPAACWPYMGFRKWDGYGWVGRYLNGKQRNLTAHRYAWIITNGSEPERGIEIMHLCDNPPCCNPAHLQLGTHDDNMADMKRKGRNNSGHIKKAKGVLWPDRVRPVKEAA